MAKNKGFEERGRRDRTAESLQMPFVAWVHLRQLIVYSFVQLCITSALPLTLDLFASTRYLIIQFIRLVFTSRCYACAVLAMGLCLCLCLSVTSRSSTKTAKRRITQTKPHDSSGTLVF